MSLLLYCQEPSRDGPVARLGRMGRSRGSRRVTGWLVDGDGPSEIGTKDGSGPRGARPVVGVTVGRLCLVVAFTTRHSANVRSRLLDDGVGARLVDRGRDVGVLRVGILDGGDVRPRPALQIDDLQLRSVSRD